MQRQWHEKYRWFFTSAGKLVICGKSAEQNEELLKNHLGKNDLVMHTKEAGSPFCVIPGRPNKTDLKEAAIFCARYSREWKKSRQDVEVHLFMGRDVYKDKKMKIGTFGVRKVKGAIKVRKKDIANPA